MKAASLYFLTMISACFLANVNAQTKWRLVDSAYGPLPKGFHVYKTTDSLDGKPNIAFYAIGKLKNKRLQFTTDTTLNRRLTPAKFYERNNKPLLVVNGTFFSFETNQNLNVVIKENKILSYNVRRIRQKSDTSKFHNENIIRGGFGISRKRKADIAWLIADTSNPYPRAWQSPVANTNVYDSTNTNLPSKNWKMQTAIAGGPVLVQNNKISVSNEQERMFTGKAILDKHPRTIIGYTGGGEIIIMVIQGRTPGSAEGATLTQSAKLMAELGCVEALNLDGGGSSCMLINGKQTIWPSDKGFERPVPAVFLITTK